MTELLAGTCRATSDRYGRLELPRMFNAISAPVGLVQASHNRILVASSASVLRWMRQGRVPECRAWPLASSDAERRFYLPVRFWQHLGAKPGDAVFMGCARGQIVIAREQAQLLLPLTWSDEP
jgi:hypothetical protein